MLQAKMRLLGINEGDLVEKFICGKGTGGQKINKTSSCVFLKYAPLNIEVKCQKSRSQYINRYYAKLMLCEKIASVKLMIKTEKEKKIAKIKRQKRKRSKRAKEKMLDGKKKRSVIKELREKITY